MCTAYFVVHRITDMFLNEHFANWVQTTDQRDDTNYDNSPNSNCWFLEVSLFLILKLILFFNFSLPPLDGVVFGAIITFVAYFFMMMSFCSPYWIESYEETRSSFKNMGLWQYCFKDFTYPNYQFSRKFTGCHNIFSHVSLSIYLLSYNYWLWSIFSVG